MFNHVTVLLAWATPLLQFGSGRRLAAEPIIPANQGKQDEIASEKSKEEATGWEGERSVRVEGEGGKFTDKC